MFNFELLLQQKIKLELLLILKIFIKNVRNKKN